MIACRNLVGIQKGKDHYVDLDIGGTRVLKFIVRRKDGVISNGCIWLSAETSAGFLLTVGILEEPSNRRFLKKDSCGWLVCVFAHGIEDKMVKLLLCSTN
jgi:hypothetical protein